MDGILPLFRGTGERTCGASDAERKSRRTAIQKVPKKVLVQILSILATE